MEIIREWQKVCQVPGEEQPRDGLRGGGQSQLGSNCSVTTCLGDYNILVDRQQLIRVAISLVELRIHFVGKSRARER